MTESPPDQVFVDAMNDHGELTKWDGSQPLPPGWFLCDGTNGTPDLRARFAVVFEGKPEPCQPRSIEERVDDFLATLRERMLVGREVEIRPELGVTRTRNFRTGWLELKDNGTWTCVININGGAIEDEAPPILPTEGEVRPVSSADRLSGAISAPGDTPGNFGRSTKEAAAAPRAFQDAARGEGGDVIDLPPRPNEDQLRERFGKVLRYADEKLKEELLTFAKAAVKKEVAEVLGGGSEDSVLSVEEAPGSGLVWTAPPSFLSPVVAVDPGVAAGATSQDEPAIGGPAESIRGTDDFRQFLKDV